MRKIPISSLSFLALLSLSAGTSQAADLLGYYDFDKDGDKDEFGEDVDLNYTHWGIGISKDAGDFGSLSFNYE